jgi:hypothetical protein
MDNAALRPLEWHRLAALHGPFCAPLHDDLYDQDGRAEQNQIPVTAATLFPAPRLAAVQCDVSALIDFTLTRYILSEDVLTALRTHPVDALIAHISHLTCSRPNSWTELRSYEIAAEAIGPPAAGWMRERARSGTKLAGTHQFIRALALCLPKDEGLDLALVQVERMERRLLPHSAYSLSAFRSPRVLRWVEHSVASPVSDGWGRIAADNGLDWSTARRWLEHGRPFSLVALDALWEIARPFRPGERGRQRDLINAPSSSELIAATALYEARDPVPRVTRLVRLLQDAWSP